MEDGRFIEHWDELNTLDIFTQIGALAPLGQPRVHGGPQQSAT